jgi:hypothetical protein
MFMTNYNNHVNINISHENLLEDGTRNIINIMIIDNKNELIMKIWKLN